MTKEQIAAIVEKQRSFFATGATMDVNYRIRALKKLRQVVAENESAIAAAMAKDLGKSATESYMCETGMVLSELSYMIRHARSFAREKRVVTPIVQFAARSYKKPMPYGVTLIMSPCIVDSSAKLKLAAKRIVFGKFLNCGQTCVAPDYILCHASVKDELAAYLKEELQRQYGGDYLNNPAYGHLISEKHFNRVAKLIDPSRVIAGGGYDAEKRKIEPTILDNVTWDDPVMQEEIFGPVLPILTFDTIDEVITTVNGHEKPLALYIYAEDKQAIKTVTSRCAFGGGCVNDCIIHLATTEMGFGGMGESGMGAYHGKTGFDTFTHYKSIVDKKTWMDLPMRYQPYRKLYDKLIHMFLK